MGNPSPRSSTPEAAAPGPSITPGRRRRSVGVCPLTGSPVLTRLSPDEKNRGSPFRLRGVAFTESLPADANSVEEAPTEPSESQAIWPRIVAVAVAAAFLGGAATYGVTARAGRPGPTEVGFFQDMIAHHENAVTMSMTVADVGMPSTVEAFAREVIVFQQYEIGLMEAKLDSWGYDRTGDGKAMEWMDDPVSVDEMPGMASSDELRQLQAARGAQAAELWLTLMTEHHRAGAAMAEAASRLSDDEFVQKLAKTMARNQSLEIREYAAVARELGLKPPPAGVPAVGGDADSGSSHQDHESTKN